MGKWLDIVFAGIVVIGVLFVLISIIYGFGHILYGLVRYWRISVSSRRLSDGLNNQSLQEYIKLLERADIPFYPGLWNTLRSTYQLVDRASHIDYELKQVLKRLLVTEGVKDI
ncbi:hypothetical protein MFMK1_001663 [Metallumcola ferriviriculae]|uniref:Uncharacterized protein n=1 Tax=Metallumcola ferriviriculae TaxID=3039180 RepID=A0AAU0UNA4_9FIRM|nr:hypothetical protein MFMK1_001663 [Desulfitibacteraceae bacterium MK1]